MHPPNSQASRSRRAALDRVVPGLYRFLLGPRASLGLALLLAAALFALDLHHYVTVAVWIFYVFPLLIVALRYGQRSALLFAGACSLLMLLGQALSPHDPDLQVAYVNRLLGVLVLWIVAVLISRMKQTQVALRESDAQLRAHTARLAEDAEHLKATEHALRQSRDDLERRVAERTADLSTANLALEQEILHHQRAQKDIRRRSEELRTLYAVAAAANVLDPEALLQRVLELVLPTLGASTGWVTLPGSTPAAPQRIVAQFGISGDFLAFEATQPLSVCPLCAAMVHDAEPSQVEPVADCPILPATLAAPAFPDSHASVPLRSGDRLLGVLNIGWHGAPDYSTEDRALLSAVGRQVGVALENAQLFEALRARAERLDMLNEIGRAVSSSLDVDSILSTLLENVRRVIDARSAAVGLVDAETGEVVLRQASGQASQDLVGLRFDPGEGIAGHVVATGRSELVPDVGVDPRINRRHGVPASIERAVKSLLCAPMTSHGNVIGVVEVFDWRPGAFDDEDVHLIESVAAQAAVAIENARLYQEEREHFQQLQQSQMKLLQSEKLAFMGRLAASFAHEINNPLQAIRSHLELVLDYPLPPEEHQQYLRIARQEIERLSAVAQRVLGFYRPAQAVRTVVLLSDLVDRTVRLATWQAERAHIQIILNLTGRIPVLVSGDQLVQVFLNLLINAIESIGHTGRIWITEQADGDDVLLTFANDGPPIAEDTLPRLFEPFFTTKPGGTGLGLSISRGLIEQHGGSLDVVNLPHDHGVAFQVRLPQAQDATVMISERGNVETNATE